MARQGKQTKRGNGVVAGQLRGFVERLERLAEDKAQISDDTKQVMAEAKATGYDPKIIRIILRERKRDQGDMAEEAALVQLYREALGMEGTPLADWAARSDDDGDDDDHDGDDDDAPDDPEPGPARPTKRAAPKRSGKGAAATPPAPASDAELAKAQGLTSLDAATRAALAWGTGTGATGEAGPEQRLP